MAALHTMTFSMSDNEAIVSSDSSTMSSAAASEEGYIRRRRYTEQELEVLMQSFRQNPKPSRAVKERLADQLGTTYKRINIWFQNQRARVKRERRDHEEQQKSASN